MDRPEGLFEVVGTLCVVWLEHLYLPNPIDIVAICLTLIYVGRKVFV